MQGLGFMVDDRFNWTALGKRIGEYRWAAIVRKRAVVRVYVVPSRPDARLSPPFNGVQEGLYLALYFRINDANSALADAVECALLDQNAEFVGRSVRRLGGKGHLVA